MEIDTFLIMRIAMASAALVLIGLLVASVAASHKPTDRRATYAPLGETEHPYWSAKANNADLAVDFALRIADQGLDSEAVDFLRAWNEGDMSEYPAFLYEAEYAP